VSKAKDAAVKFNVKEYTNDALKVGRWGGREGGREGGH